MLNYNCYDNWMKNHSVKLDALFILNFHYTLTKQANNEQKHMRTKVLKNLVLTMYLILLALSKTTGFW
jgi:hypothetical protein